jgi:hypothetical protein
MSRPFASAIGANVASSARRSANAWKKRSMAASSTAPSSIAASTAAVTAARAALRAAAGTWSSSPCGLVDEQGVAGDEGRREVRRYRHDPVAAEHDGLARDQPLEGCGARTRGRTGCGGRGS